MQFSKSVKGLIMDSPYQPLHLFGIKRRLVNLFSGNFLIPSANLLSGRIGLFIFIIP